MRMKEGQEESYESRMRVECELNESRIRVRVLKIIEIGRKFFVNDKHNIKFID
jgi:hypothetical protein